LLFFFAARFRRANIERRAFDALTGGGHQEKDRKRSSPCSGLKASATLLNGQGMVPCRFFIYVSNHQSHEPSY
jgi:hypothetical protein